MLLTPVLAWLVFILISLLVLFLFSRILKKTSLNTEKRQSLIVLLFIGFGITFLLTSRKVYVINSQTSQGTYILIGQTTFKFKNGTEASFGMGSKYRVVNNSDKTLANERLSFGKSYRFVPHTDPIDIEAYSTKPVPEHIEFLMDSSRPTSTRVSGGTEEITQYWLHESIAGHYVESPAGENTGTQMQEDKNSVADPEKRNSTESFVDSMMSIPAYSDQMNRIARYFAPFRIETEKGSAQLIFINRDPVSLKKIPLDSLLNFKKEFYEFQTYDRFYMPGKPRIMDFYFDRGKEKTIILQDLKLEPDLKETRGTAFLMNQSDDKRLVHAEISMVVVEEKDTLMVKSVGIQTDIPPRTYQSVPFTITALKKSSFKKKNEYFNFFNFSYELLDYTLK